jgi:hypothetical protein
MTWKDKLEIGLKDDAPYRRDNLPDFQQRKGSPETKPGDPTRSPEEPGAREDAGATAARPTPISGERTRPRTTTRKNPTRKKTDTQ